MSKPLTGAAAAGNKSRLGAPIGRGDFPGAVFQGSTPHFRVYSQPALGSAGAQAAAGVLAACESDYGKLKAWFADRRPSKFPFNIIIAKLKGGGAYHYGCAGVDIYCDVRLTPTVDSFYTEFLAMSEIAEVFAAAYGAGWGCKRSKGEGLSRVLATELYPTELGTFATAHYWLDGARRNFVNKTAPTDTNQVANGCAVLFLNYLHYQLGYSWNDIIAAGGQNLRQTWTRLAKPRGNAKPFKRFKALLNKQFPAGTPSNLANDNPWPIKPAAAPPTAAPVSAPGTGSAPVPSPSTPAPAAPPPLPAQISPLAHAALAHSQPSSPRAPQKPVGLIFRPPERPRPLTAQPQPQHKHPQPPAPHPAAHAEQHHPAAAKDPAKSSGVRRKPAHAKVKDPAKPRRAVHAAVTKHPAAAHHTPASAHGSESSRASGGKSKPKT